jgi:hypothetical protein
MTQGLESLAGNATGAKCDEAQIASPTTQAIALCAIAASALSSGQAIALACLNYFQIQLISLGHLRPIAEATASAARIKFKMSKERIDQDFNKNCTSRVLVAECISPGSNSN